MCNSKMLRAVGCCALTLLAGTHAYGACSLSPAQVTASPEYHALKTLYNGTSGARRTPELLGFLISRQVPYLGDSEHRREMFDCLLRVAERDIAAGSLFLPVASPLKLTERFQMALYGLLDDADWQAVGVDPGMAVPSIFAAHAQNPPSPTNVSPTPAPATPPAATPTGSPGILARIEQDSFGCRDGGTKSKPFVLCRITYSLENTTEEYIHWTDGDWEREAEDGSRMKRDSLSYRRKGIEPGADGRLVFTLPCYIPGRSATGVWRAWGTGRHKDSTDSAQFSWNLETQCLDTRDR